ncbi:MAG: signal recognition particle-docking protein FtsY [Thermoplasmatales archaeon]|nr:MAG: signal recognition particle-docking protein FtsY [Thermoplasmatales archaeon]
MFKFLKKKLKKFEDELEAELERELEKETIVEEKEKTPIKTTPSVEKKPVETEPIEPPQEKPTPVIEKKPVEKETVETPREEPTPDIEIKPIETEPVEPPEEKPTPEEIQIKKEEPKPKVEKPTEEKKIIPRVRLRDKERRLRIERDKRKREEEIDKQIEKSIETELEHTLKTKRSIEEVVTTEKISSRGISEEKLDDLLWELEVGLLESDVAYSVIESIKKDIKEELKYASFERGKINEMVENVLKNAISHVLKSSEIDFMDFIKSANKPIVIMFVGVNGSGKTLAIAKIATLLRKNGISSVMAAGDTFRAGAIEQLNIHADKVGVKIIKHGSGADPAAVAYDAIDHAKAKHKDVVLLDTAGRVQTNINLMDEMAKIKRVAKPDLIIFVGDALSGNDAVEQAKRFNEVVGIDGVILTKVDTDAKGGSALSVAYTIGKPLLFIGVGQGYEDQIPFEPEWMMDNIFGK